MTSSQLRKAEQWRDAKLYYEEIEHTFPLLKSSAIYSKPHFHLSLAPEINFICFDMHGRPHFFFAAVPEHGMVVHMTHGEGLEAFEWNMKKIACAYS